MVEVEPVEESIQHFGCITAFILMTVFDKHHKSTFITTAFEKLPVHTPRLVFEDVSEDLEQPKQLVKPTDSVNLHVPQPIAKGLLTRADLNEHQLTYKAILKCQTLDTERMAAFISKLIQCMEEVATECPMILFIKAVEETSSHVNHRMTVVSLKTAGVYDISPSYIRQLVNTTFTTPPILKPVVMLENASSLQNQEPPSDLDTCLNPRVAQPEMKVQLTLADLDNHKKTWRAIQKCDTLDADKMKKYMSQTIQKVEQLVTQIEFYQKEINTHQENERLREQHEQQLQQLKLMYPAR